MGSTTQHLPNSGKRTFIDYHVIDQALRVRLEDILRTQPIVLPNMTERVPLNVLQPSEHCHWVINRESYDRETSLPGNHLELSTKRERVVGADVFPKIGRNRLTFTGLQFSLDL